MADKIVVLNAGKIEQSARRSSSTNSPANLFVAGFIGSPKMNFITGEAAQQRGAATIGVRPEHLKVEREGRGLAGNGDGRRASRQRHLPLCRCRPGRARSRRATSASSI